MEPNLSAPSILTRELGKDMVARGSDKIILTASLLTFQGGVTVPSYAGQQGRNRPVTKAFANELAGSGVNVNAIAPEYWCKLFEAEQEALWQVFTTEWTGFYNRAPQRQRRSAERYVIAKKA